MDSVIDKNARAIIKVNILYETTIPIDEWQDIIKNDIEQELNYCTYSPNEGTLKIDWERSDKNE